MFYPSWRPCHKCGEKFFADADWKKICLSCWKISKKIDTKKKKYEPPPFQYAPPPPPPTIDKEMLRRLIYLCHPDKHSNSQASHLATDWLLKQRKP